ncbi:hypothetical protein ABFV55_27605, partial [Pseudomonas syringae]
AVPDLAFWQSLEEREVEEGVHRSMVSSHPVLVVAGVDGDLNADASVNQADDSRWNTDVVCGPSVSRTCESKNSS